MEKQGKKGFKIGLNTSHAHDDTEKEILVLTEKKQTATPFMCIVLAGFIILGGTLVWGYYDLRKALNAINTSGSAEIEDLSRDLNSKMFDLLQNLADQKSATQNRLDDIDGAIKAITADLAEIKTNKSDKPEVAAGISEIQTSLEAINKNAEAMSQSINDLIGKADSTISSIKKAQAVIQQNRQDIEMLDAKSIDHATFETALKKEREFNQENMAHATEALFSEIASLQKAVKALTDNSNGADKTDAAKPKKNQTPAENPDKIIEQEIK